MIHALSHTRHLAENGRRLQIHDDQLFSTTCAECLHTSIFQQEQRFPFFSGSEKGVTRLVFADLALFPDHAKARRWEVSKYILTGERSALNNTLPTLAILTQNQPASPGL